METITESHHWLKLNEQMIVGVHVLLKHVQYNPKTEAQEILGKRAETWEESEN